jgi:DNA-binding NarL/FixJ family response regulator
MTVLLVCRDLMAISSIGAVVGRLSGRLQTVHRLQDLPALATSASVVLIDLASCESDLAEAIRDLRQRGSTARILAFGPHVQRDVLDKALEAGCDQVLPRGQFLSQLERLLSG